MGSGSYSSADIARFVANMAKNGGYTDSVPASIEGIGKKIRLDPALLVAFYHGTQTPPDV